MQDFLAYTVLGICLGSVYAIAATGLVVTYSTSGVFNLAHGAVATFCALIYWQLRWDWGVNPIISLVLTVAVFAPLIVWAFWIGLNPQPYFRVLERPVAHIVERVHPGYYAERHLANPLDAPARQASLR